MRRLLPFVLLLGAIRTVDAAGIRAYDVVVRVTPSGTADVGVVLRVEDAAGVLRIPAGFVDISALRIVDAPSGTVIASEPAGKQTLLRVTLPSATPSPVTLSLAFTAGAVLPASAGAGPARRLSHALLNSQPDPIDAYTVRAVLPPGSRAHAVREALPPRKASDTDPRVELVRVDGASGAVLRVTRLAQGETASMQIETAPDTRSALWLIAGMSLSLLYLVRFRDLVMPAASSATRIP